MSRNSHVSAKASSDTPAATRNTGWSAAAKAFSNAVRTAGGRWWMISGLVALGICAFDGRREASSTARRLAKIVPKSATPIEPPI